MGDLAGMSYWSNYQSGLDWQIKIYTKKTGAGWFDNRFNIERPDGADDGQWDFYSTDTLKVEWIQNYNTGSRINTYPDLLLNELSDYADEEIMFIDVIAGYGTNSPPSYTYLDGVTIALNTGECPVLDLAAVPAPGAMLPGSIGMGMGDGCGEDGPCSKPPAFLLRRGPTCQSASNCITVSVVAFAWATMRIPVVAVAFALIAPTTIRAASMDPTADCTASSD